MIKNWDLHVLSKKMFEKHKVFKTVVPRNVRVSEAPSHGKPALFYDFKSSGAQAYLRVATEIVNALEKRN